MSITPKQIKFDQKADKDILDHLENNKIIFAKYVRELIRKDIENQNDSNDLEEEIEKIKKELKELRELVLNGAEAKTVITHNEEACTIQESQPLIQNNEVSGIDDLIF